MLSDNMRGALLMMMALTAFVVNDTFVRLAADHLPFFQLIFLRGLVITLGLGMLLWRQGHLRFRVARRDGGLIGLRTLCEMGGTLLFLTALMNMPFANLSAILQALPLSVSLGAALFFKEPIGWRRLTAIVVGFIGVLLIVQPGTEGFNIYAVFGVLTVLVVTVRDLAARRLSRAVPSGLVALAAAVGGTLMGAVGGLSEDWVQPDALTLLKIVAAGVCLIFGYIGSVAAMRIGEIGFVAPFRYVSLLVALIIGLVIFKEWPGPVTLLGAAIVVGTGLFTLYRERASARKTPLGLRVR